MKIAFTVPGAPRSKKNSGNFEMRGRRRVLVPSKAWLRWRDEASARRREWLPRAPLILPRREFVNAEALFYLDADRRVDACNLYEGLADLLEDCGVIANDFQIKSWDGSRVYLDRENPRTEVVLERID